MENREINWRSGRTTSSSNGGAPTPRPVLSKEAQLENVRRVNAGLSVWCDRDVKSCEPNLPKRAGVPERWIGHLEQNAVCSQLRATPTSSWCQSCLSCLSCHWCCCRQRASRSEAVPLITTARVQSPFPSSKELSPTPSLTSPPTVTAWSFYGPPPRPPRILTSHRQGYLPHR